MKTSRQQRFVEIRVLGFRKVGFVLVKFSEFGKICVYFSQTSTSHETLSASRSRDFPRGKILWRKVDFFEGKFQNYERLSWLRSYFSHNFKQNIWVIIFAINYEYSFIFYQVLFFPSFKLTEAKIAINCCKIFVVIFSFSQLAFAQH